MAELFVRIAVSLSILALGVLGFIPFDAAWKASAALACLSVFGWLIERRRLKNSGIAGFFAVADALVLALLLASSGGLHQFGFLVLIPCLYAGAQFGSSIVSMAPMAATALVAAGALFSKTGLPEPEVFMHAAGVLSVSLLLNQRKTTTRSQPAATNEERPSQAPQMIEDGLLQLRENFRKLRDAYNDLERRSRKDKIAARIGRARSVGGTRFYSEMRIALCELSRAEELAIYTLAQMEQVMVVRDVSDNFPGGLRDRSIEVDVSKSPAVVREQAEDALSALSADAPISNVLLIHRGKVVGMVCAIDAHPAKLEEIRKALNEAAPFAAEAIVAELSQAASARRLHELELLYEMTSLATGATTPADLAGRVVREVTASLRLDSCRVAFIKNGKERAVANQGTISKLLDCMTFIGGAGIPGWITAGSPELVIFDARQDQRCNADETLKRRIGSFTLIPIWTGLDVVGYLSASTQLPGGIDVDQVATLRLVAAELSRAFERISGARAGGLMTPQEFSKATAGRDGALVYLEPLRREQMISTFGMASHEEALRKLAHQIRAKLPQGSCLCRRDEGDYLAFLDSNEDFARAWANEIAASASFIGLSSSEASRRVPLALRARVAQVTSQSDRLSKEIAA
jgi:hypothetical protein